MADAFDTMTSDRPYRIKRPPYGPERVLDALEVPSLESWAVPGAEAARVLFLPSFHPECALTASLNDERPVVTLVTAQTNLWYWWCHQIQEAQGLRVHEVAPPPPERWQERADIPADHVDRFRAKFLSIDPISVSDTDLAGLDGMSIVGQYHSREGLTSKFRHHIGADIGADNNRGVAFVLALYEVGTALLHDERSVRVLESLHGYLGLGLVKHRFSPKEERDLAKARKEEQARRERARLDAIDVHNEACRALATDSDEGLICPHCGRRSREDIEFVDYTRQDRKSFFVCRACGRSFGHEL